MPIPKFWYRRQHTTGIATRRCLHCCNATLLETADAQLKRLATDSRPTKYCCLIWRHELNGVSIDAAGWTGRQWQTDGQTGRETESRCPTGQCRWQRSVKAIQRSGTRTERRRLSGRLMYVPECAIKRSWSGGDGGSINQLNPTARDNEFDGRATHSRQLTDMKCHVQPDTHAHVIDTAGAAVCVTSEILPPI